MTILGLLVLLIPAPFVHLGLGEACGLGDTAAGLLGPIGVFGILLHKVLHLVWIFTISLFSTLVHHSLMHLLAVVKAVLWLLILDLMVRSLSWCCHWGHHLTAQLVVILWAELPNLWTGCWLIFVILVTTQHKGLECLSPLPILISSGVVNEVVILKEFFSVPWRVFLHGIGMNNDFFFLLWFFFFDFLIGNSTAKGSLIVQWDLFLLLGSRGSRLMRAKVTWMRKVEIRSESEGWRYHGGWRGTVRTMNHAACNGLLLLVIGLFLGRF